MKCIPFSLSIEEMTIEEHLLESLSFLLQDLPKCLITVSSIHFLLY